MGFCASANKARRHPPVDACGVTWPTRIGPAKSPSSLHDVGKRVIVHVWTKDQKLANDIEADTYARWMGRGPPGCQFDFYGDPELDYQNLDRLGLGKPFAGIILDQHVQTFADLRPGTYWVEDYLRLFYDQEKLDVQIHEIGGHGVKGWWHGVRNTIMNGDYRAKVGHNLPADRKALVEAIRDRYDTVEVRQGTPFAVLIDELVGLGLAPGDHDGAEWGHTTRPAVPA